MSYIVTKLGMSIDLSVAGKVACPKCVSEGKDRSQDNFMVYGLDSDDRHKGGHCFSCDYTIPSEEWLEENGQEEEKEYVEIMGKEFNKEVYNKIVESSGTDPKGYRGISREVSEFFKVRYVYSEEDGSIAETLYPTTKAGKMAGFKVRRHPKNFAGPWGETGKDCDMFGQVKFSTQTGHLMIVGGEHDALAAYQMMKSAQKEGTKFDPVAVVSATIGESGAVKQVQANYNFFNQFKRIYVCMDNDDAGRKAADALAKVLPRGKVHIMKMRYKDPNKYLELGKGHEFYSDYWGAGVWTPAGVHASGSLYDAARSYAEVKQLGLPDFLPKCREMFGGEGLVKGEITVIFAKTSVGKSSFIDAFTVTWALHEREEVVGILSLEATVEKYATNLFSNYLGTKLIRMRAEERLAYLEQPDVKEKLEKLLKTEEGVDRFFVCDDRGADINVVKEKLEEMVIRSGVTILIIDPFSDLMAGMDINAQEEFVAWLKKFLKEFPHVSLVLVCHTRKGDKNESLREEDIIGTSTIMKSAAQTISLERDKLHDNPIMRNVTKVTIHKNRHYGETGAADDVFYEWQTAQLINFEQYLRDNPDVLAQLGGAKQE